MEYEVIVIGGGPAGYVAAIRASQIGMKTALIEKKHIGGMCMNWGCVPVKSYVESAKFYHRLRSAEEFGIQGIDLKNIQFDWNICRDRTKEIVKRLSSGIEYLLKKYGVDLIQGEGVITSNRSVSVDNRKLDTKYIIIATGSYPNPIPGNIDQKHIQSLERLAELEKIPQHISLFGTGPAMVELAQFFRYIGKDVTIISNHSNLLYKADEYLNEFIQKKLKADKIKVLFADHVDAFENGKLKIGTNTFSCDLLINANLRTAVLPRMEIDVTINEEGFIVTDDFLSTNKPGIYAIGDVHGKSYLAHAASAQGIWVINHIKGVRKELKLDNYPLNIYTNPEIAQVGMTEEQVRKTEISYKINEFPLSANAKAQIEGNTEGVVRIISEAKFGQVLGVQIVANNATDMIAEAQAFMQIEGTVFDVAQTIHAHPTVSEIFMEAGFDAMEQSVHK